MCNDGKSEVKVSCGVARLVTGRSLVCLKFRAVFVFAVFLISVQGLAASSGTVGSGSSAEATPLENSERNIRTSELLPSGEPEPFACGPASMAIALKILGAEITNEELSLLSDETSTSNFATLADYAHSKGLYTEAVRLGPEHLVSLYNVAILQIYTGLDVDEDGREQPHFVVHAGPVDEETVYVFDSRGISGMRGAFPLDELAEMWTGRALIISKYPIDLSTLKKFSENSSFLTTQKGFASLAVIGLSGIIIIPVFLMVRKRRRVLNSSGRTILLILFCFILVGSAGEVFAKVPASVKSGHDLHASSKETKSSRYVVGAVPYKKESVSKGTDIEHTFEIYNPDDKTIKIRLGKSSCACLEAKIVGPNSIGPGKKSAVSVKVHAGKGGGLEQGVLLHISGEKKPVSLKIAATVKNDTQLLPKNLDFGDIIRTDGLVLRPLRIVHYGDKKRGFHINEIVSDSPFITITNQSTPKETLMDGGVMKYEYHIAVAADANGLKVGSFLVNVKILATSGETPLRFNIPCSGKIIPTIYARPNRILKIKDVLPDEVTAEIKLKAAIGTRIVIGSVKVNGMGLVKWFQEAKPETQSTLLTVVLRPGVDKGRVEGMCTVTLAEPAGETVEIPIRLIGINNTKNEKT